MGLGSCKYLQSSKSSEEVSVKEPPLQVGDRVYVYMPQEKQGKAYKFALPFAGPYWVVELHPNGMVLQHIEKPNSRQIQVALNCALVGD